MGAGSERPGVAATQAAALAVLRGCAQLAFCRTAGSGAAVLAGIALLSPSCALGTIAGAAFGTSVGRSIGYAEPDWRAGLAGFNPALVGLLWGGMLDGGEWRWPLFTLALAASMVLDLVVRRVAARASLPALTCGALIAVWCAAIGGAPEGGWMLLEPRTTAFVPYGIAGTALIVLAAAYEAPFAAAWTLLLAIAAALLVVIAGHDIRATVGLWATTVPLAGYGVCAVFLRHSLPGALAAAVSAVAAGATWIAWHAVGLADLLPPLVAPFIVGTWVGIVTIRALAARMTLPFSRLARHVALAHATGRPVVVILADGGGSPSLLHPGIAGAATLDAEALAASRRARASLWEAIASARDRASARGGTELPAPLASLLAEDFVAAVVRAAATEQDERPRTIALRGRLDRTECLGCGIGSHWPPLALWRRMDLRCPECGGPVVPDRSALGLTLAPSIARRLSAVGAHRSLVLVDTDGTDDPLVPLAIEQLRASGATLAFVGRDRHRAMHPHDLRVAEPFVPTLVRLVRVLAVVRVAGRVVRWPRGASLRAGHGAREAVHDGPD